MNTFILSPASFLLNRIFRANPSLLFIAVALWMANAAAIATPGTVVAWGFNTFGQLDVPVGLSGVTAIAAGDLHTVALKSDGTVVAWGAGKTNTGSFPERGQSIVPNGLSGVTAIAAGGSHTVALKSNGTVVAWGRNDFAQTTVPVGLSGVTAIAAGSFHTVALKSNGTVVAWGANDQGQATVPAGLSGVIAIAAGALHTVALKSNGTVVAWGYNFYGQTTVPAGLSGVTAIAGGDEYTVALKNNGTVVAWGANSGGQTTIPAGLSGVTAIAAGFNLTVALKSNGTVVTWGFTTVVPVGLSGVTAIAAGTSHTVALKSTSGAQSPTATTGGSSGVSTTSATVTGSVNANGSNTTVSFEYGVTTAYGSVKTATPSTASGSTSTAVSAALTGLAPNTTYHYRVKAVSTVGTTYGSDATYTTASVQAAQAPVITNQPTAQRDISTGSQATFSVSADGTSLNFQWFKDGKAISGAVGSSLSINAVTLSNAGAYTCRISNSAGKVTTEAVILSVVDSSLLIYKVSGTETDNEGATTRKSAVGGWLVLDRSGQQGAFVWTGKQGKQKIYWVERRADLATHSTGPVAKSTTVVVADETAGEHPDVEHNLVWLRGRDALVKLSAFDHTIAPAVMAGTIGRLTLGDNPFIQTLAVSLVLDKTKSTMSRANSDDVEAAINRLVSVLNAAGYLEQ